MKQLMMVFTLFILSACTPNYEKRDIVATQIDLEILEEVESRLIQKNWTKEYFWECKKRDKLNLFCLLKQSSIKVLGKYNHRQVALQEVRFVIDDSFHERWDKHRLMDFNTHSKTTFEDVKLVIHRAKKRVEEKLKEH